MTKMVDINDKPVVKRKAIAEGRLRLKPETLEAIKCGTVKKGDVFEISEVAGILAAKETARSIPLCHQIPLSAVDIVFFIEGNCVIARTTVMAESKTGVEMEALVATSVALLNILDMVKYLEKDENGQYPVAEIFGIRVIQKSKEEL